MSWLLPLPAVIPLLAAAVNIAGDHVLPRWVGSAISLGAAASAFAISIVLMLESQHRELLHWFGGWHPRSGVAVGIAFTADPLGAGMAALSSFLVLAALVYSLTFLKEAARPYDVLMIVFCGAMCGFCLTGDLFNMFVWLELMSVAAYALTGFKIAELGPLQGAVNFAVCNTVGGYMVLIGIGLLYARTGALNLAQIGRALAGQKPDGLVVVALTLIVVGFLVKAAMVPFHFWLADAHAAAPAPVCVLFSGVMVELGLLGVARCYWTIFDGPFGAHQDAIRNVLVTVGLLAAVVGAVMAFLQRHLKRLLAFSTISHAGAMLVGIALLDSKSLAGVADLVLSHALLKGSLFLCCGVLLVKLRSVDELALHGRGRGYRTLGAIFTLGGVGLVGLPYLGTYLGHAQIDEGATLAHIEWIQPLLMITAALSAAAILRAAARVFLGWGPKDDALLTAQPSEDPEERDAHLPLMLSVATVLLVLGLVVSVIPGLGQRAEYGAERFRDRAGYAERVLHGQPMQQTPRLPFSIAPTPPPSWLYGVGSGALTLLFAAFGLHRHRLPRSLRRGAARVAYPTIDGLRAVHSGIVGDYVMWLTVGTAVIGGVWAFTLT
jgi:multicomponent Na+:H+ antiporter subunit D